MGGSISKKGDVTQLDGGTSSSSSSSQPSSQAGSSRVLNPINGNGLPQFGFGGDDLMTLSTESQMETGTGYTDSREHSSYINQSTLTGGDVPEPVESVIPTVFRWEHGGNQVYITGSFNHWNRRVPMHRSGNDFIYIQSLAKGKYAYKFIVDDEWRFAPDQATISDASGNVNNCIDLTTFSPDDESSTPSNKRRDSLPGSYGRNLPDEDEYSKEPPLLPPHLRHIVLNSPPPGDDHDPLQLENPKHVTLTHLYCTAIVNGLMVQAISHRYRRKMTTTIFYSLSPSTEAWA
jgi:hypothetical protein